MRTCVVYQAFEASGSESGTMTNEHEAGAAAKGAAVGNGATGAAAMSGNGERPSSPATAARARLRLRVANGRQLPLPNAIEPSLHGKAQVRAGRRARSAASKTQSPTVCVRNPPELYDFHDLPGHLMENRFVLSNHRAHYSIADCWRSVLFLHSETMNIWTHLVGGLIFLWNALLLPGTTHPLVRVQAALTAAGFLVSVAAHTFTPYSEPMYRMLFKLDRVGVAIFLGGAVVAALSQCFRCAPLAQTVWVLAGVALATLASILNFGPSTNNRKRVLYVVTYSLEVLMSAFPVFVERWRLLANEGAYSSAAAAAVHANVDNAALAYLFGAIGSVFYASNLPERLKPGSFDYLPGHSLMHIFSVMATLQFLKVTMSWEVVAQGMQCDAVPPGQWGF